MSAIPSTVNFSSPSRGEVGAQATGGGDATSDTSHFGVCGPPPPSLPPQGEGVLSGGTKPFTRHVRKNAIKLRNQMTEAEKKLWYHLRTKHMGVKFRRQQPISNYIVDFISFDIKLIIELDGGQHGSQQAYDQTRDKFLKNEGFTVLRFWNNEIFDNLEGVLFAISEHVAHPLLTSPLDGEELLTEARA